MSYPEWIRRYRRKIGIPLIVLAFWLAKFDGQYLPWSLLLVGVGEFIRIWSAGHLRKEKILTTGGPYGLVRNPLYLGSFLIALGFCLVAGSLWIWGIVFVYFGACYLPVIRYEEKVLSEKFPEDYPKYAAEVPALYPSVRIYSPATTNFSWKQVLANKEYNALLGIILAYGILIFLRAQ